MMEALRREEWGAVKFMNMRCADDIVIKAKILDDLLRMVKTELEKN